MYFVALEKRMSESKMFLGKFVLNDKKEKSVLSLLFSSFDFLNERKQVRKKDAFFL